MIAPRPSVTDTKGTTYPIVQFGGAWTIEFAGAKYFLTAGDDPTLRARDFLKTLPKNAIYPRTSVWIASPMHPLVLDVDGVIVRAWAALPTRDDPPRTFRHPHWSQRVQALGKGMVWMFVAIGHERSPGGKAEETQGAAEVAQLAREWLGSARSEASPAPG